MDGLVGLPRARWQLTRWSILTLAALALSCGGAAPFGIDKAKLEAGIKTETDKQLATTAFSARVSTVSCVQDTDAYHFVCLVQFTDNSNATFKATCDGDGSCVWRPE